RRHHRATAHRVDDTGRLHDVATGTLRERRLRAQRLERAVEEPLLRPAPPSPRAMPAGRGEVELEPVRGHRRPRTRDEEGYRNLEEPPLGTVGGSEHRPQVTAAHADRVLAALAREPEAAARPVGGGCEVRSRGGALPCREADA